MRSTSASARSSHPGRKITRGLRRAWFYRHLYLLMLPGLLYYVVFHYLPMWGVVVAFQDFHLWLGLKGSPWVGLSNFRLFFGSPYFLRLMRNTLLISILKLCFAFPVPVALALLLDEVRNRHFKRVIQTVSYLPHFISWVVVYGLLIYVFSQNVGVLNIALSRLDLPPLIVLGKSSAFLPLVVGSDIWKEAGWEAIIYLAAISGINPELYEAAIADGASRFQRVRYVTLPSIAPVIVIMLILRVGAILTVNFEQILILMGNNVGLYEVGDVIQTWVYRVAFTQQNMGLATAVDLFRGVIALAMVWTANRVANRITEGGGLW